MKVRVRKCVSYRYYKVPQQDGEIGIKDIEKLDKIEFIFSEGMSEQEKKRILNRWKNKDITIKE